MATAPDGPTHIVTGTSERRMRSASSRSRWSSTVARRAVHLQHQAERAVGRGLVDGPLDEVGHDRIEIARDFDNVRNPRLRLRGKCRWRWRLRPRRAGSVPATRPNAASAMQPATRRVNLIELPWKKRTAVAGL